MQVLVPMETGSGCPGTGVKGGCEGEDGESGTELRSPVRATNALNYELPLQAPLTVVVSTYCDLSFV